LRSPQPDAESVYTASAAKGAESTLGITDSFDGTVKLVAAARLQAQGEADMNS